MSNFSDGDMRPMHIPGTAAGAIGGGGPSEHLNAAQLAQVDKAVAKIIGELQLRKYCADLACRTTNVAPMGLAREMYDFIVEGTK